MYYGCKKEIEDKRDYKSYVSNIKQSLLPTEYTISMPEVKDQGIVNSCVAHSLATFLEECHKEENLKFSVGFIYGYRPINYDQNEGMYPREALKTITKIGDVTKDLFDHNKEIPEIKQLVDNDIKNLKEQAANYKVNSYSRIYTTYEIKNCIFNDTPVPISIPVYNDLMYDKDTFIIQGPSGSIEGYHMIIIYGYNEKGWLIQNSWGKDWANSGTAILPYDYPIDSAWAIDTNYNNVITYQTIWQKLYSLYIKIINKLKGVWS